MIPSPSPSGSMRHSGEVATHNFPLLALFDEHQRGSAVDRQGLAVLGRSYKRVVSIHDPEGIVVHSARGLSEAKTRRSDSLERFVEILRENLLAVETIGNVIKDLDVVGEH